MKSFFITILAVICYSSSFSQTPIDVYESTLKVPGGREETYLCGLAEGDQLIFNFEEVNGKEMKEVEILEYPYTSKFMDYKTKRIYNKTLNITKTGIYKFRFANSSLLGRICYFKIQRIPGSEQTKNFNSSVYYSTNTDTIITNVVDQVAKVHSTMNAEGNISTLNFALPANTIAWSYYVGVDQVGIDCYEKAVRDLSRSNDPMVNTNTGYNPLAALALGKNCYLSHGTLGEDIDYVITDNMNANAYLRGQAYNYFKKGKVLNDYAMMSSPKSGNLNVCLRNDNAVTGVTVLVKITAISISSYTEPYLKD